MSLQAWIIRFLCAKSDIRRDWGLTVPADVAVFRDLRYGTDKRMQVLDIYRPKQEHGKLPVIVSFHGGGWVYGSKAVYQYYCMELARQGFAVVNFSYRLAPEHRLPAAFEDAGSVFSFVMQHAAEYGLDTDNVFGVGDSAGATGIAVCACALTNPAYAADFPAKLPEGLNLRGLALNCGLYSMRGKRKAMRDILPKAGAEKVLRMMHIPRHITPAFPPCFVLTSHGDFLRDEPKYLLPVLEKNGIRYQYRIYGDEQHPLCHVFHCNVRDADAQAANKEELAFFRSLL